MKSKGIIIELTALLDVIFIMLFWAMNTAQLENQQIRNDAETRIAEAEQFVSLSREECEKVRREAKSEIKKAWETAENINKKAAENQKALDGYRSGEIITVRIVDNNVEISDSVKIVYSGAISESCILSSLASAEKSNDDVILCAFVYDGNSALYTDVQTVSLAITSAEKEYPNFYCTKINTSN